MNVIFAQNSCTRWRTARHLVILLLLFSGFLAAGPAMAVDNIQSGHAGAEGGDWGGANGAIIGPADFSCANMGAVGKVNLASDFGFSIPAGAAITGATAFIKSSSQGGQNIGVQLASDAANDSPTVMGNPLILAVFNSASGSCATTAVTEIGTTIGSWGLASLSPAVVNATSFGLVFTKLEISSIKVDSVCVEIAYTTAGGDAVQSLCFEAPPPPQSNTIRVIKDLVGAPPATNWGFTGDLGNFSLPPSGGSQDFSGLNDGSYTITETTKPGYTVSTECRINNQVVASGAASVTVAVAQNQLVECTFTNTLPPPAVSQSRATFTVNKTFTDGNIETPVTYNISCNTGVPLIQQQTAPAGQFAVEFVVESFDQGELNCHVWETAVAGYSAEYEVIPTVFSVESAINNVPNANNDNGCHFDEVDSRNYIEGDMNVCQISNSPNPVTISVTKDWVVDGSGGDVLDSDYTLTLSCDGLDDQVRFNSSGTADAVYTFGVIPDWDGGTDCSVDEQVFDDSIEVDNDCGALHVDIGQGDSCTITNTVFFEGIPTLSQYGLAILALLMLGVGFVGFRRLV